MKILQAVLVFAISTLALGGCGEDSTPTSETPLPRSPVVSTEASQRHARLQADEPINTSISNILSDVGQWFGVTVRIFGRVTKQLSETTYAFDDPTGRIVARFDPDAGPVPALDEPIQIVGPVVPIGTVVAIDVEMWQPFELTCGQLQDVRARFSDPGFASGNTVGLFLSYEGAPPGEKTIEIIWDEEHAPDAIQRVSFGEGTRSATGFDASGVVTHGYGGLAGAEEKRVRATLRIEGAMGGCARVRRVVVSP